MLGVLRGTLEKFPQISVGNQTLVVALPFSPPPEKHTYAATSEGTTHNHH
jgi:hypothetical protein